MAVTGVFAPLVLDFHSSVCIVSVWFLLCVILIVLSFYRQVESRLAGRSVEPAQRREIMQHLRAGDPDNLAAVMLAEVGL